MLWSIATAMTTFMAPLSWQSHRESSPSTLDECKTVLSGCQSLKEAFGQYSNYFCIFVTHMNRWSCQEEHHQNCSFVPEKDRLNSQLEDHMRALNAGIDDPPKEWRRPRGRPRQTWLHTVENDLKQQNLGLWSARQAQSI